MTRRVVPDRVRWAVSVVDAGPATRVLEIGCGPGAAAELVCPGLTGCGRVRDGLERHGWSVRPVSGAGGAGVTAVPA